MKNIKSLVLFLALVFFANVSFGQSVLGVWKTIDDETGEPKSHVKIYKKDGKLFGRVVKLLPKATTSTCDGCPGDKNGKSLLDVDILWDLESDGDGVWDDGKIVDPANGKVYSCKISLDTPDRLKVRGYLGFSLFGRTQIWHRVK